jgi:DNA-binding transcriptional MocR family regulator
MQPSGRGGLIFGYSNLSERAITDGVARLARSITALRQGT